MDSQPVRSDIKKPPASTPEQEPVLEIIHRKPIMDQRTLTSTEKEARRKHADVIMSKWIGLKKELKEADRLTIFRFCLYLQIMGLSLFSDYNSRDARSFLARDGVSILRVFFEGDEGLDPESVDLTQGDHIIALARGLFEVAGGGRSALWDDFDNDYSEFDNQTLCGFMVDVVGMMSLEEAHAAQLYHAILRSKLLLRNKTPSFAMFLKYIEDCRSVIDPAQRRCFTEGSNCEEMH